MGDFVPGYVSTLNNSRFKQIDDTIIILGQETGFVYAKYKTKEAFISKVQLRRSRMTMMCYYKNPIEFSQSEMEFLWRYNIYPISHKDVHHMQTTVDYF